MKIEINPQFTDMIAYSILTMAQDHKRDCPGSECSVTLFPLRSLITQLLGRQLSLEEERILS